MLAAKVLPQSAELKSAPVCPLCTLVIRLCRVKTVQSDYFCGYISCFCTNNLKKKKGHCVTERRFEAGLRFQLC